VLRLGLPFVAFVVILLWWLADAEPVPRLTSEAGAELPGAVPAAAAVPVAEADPPEAAASAAAPRGQGRTTEGPSLEGTVTDPAGRGVEGVALRALFQRHGSSGYKHYCGFEASRTDRAGQFRMEVPFTAEWATLWIDAPGWVRPPPRAVGPEVYDVLDRRVGWSRQSIALERGAPVEGVVEAATGIPLADVQIEATWGDSRAGRSLCRTDERGRFSIVVPAKAVLVARAHRGELVTPDEGPGFPWEAVPLRFAEILTHDAEAWAGPVEPGSSNVRMVLSDVVPLRMRVRGPSGAISGYVVLRVTDLAWPAGSFVCEPYVREGEDLIEVPGLMHGTYEVEVLPKHQKWLPARARATLPGEPIDVRCEQALSIEGLLEGEDLRDFEITWTGPCNEGFEDNAQRGRTLRVKTATFVLRGIADGVGDVYARRAGDSRFAFATAVRPGPGVLRLTLSKGRAITGRVATPAGLKPATLDVRAVSGLVEQRARVRGDGTFSIVGLPPGTFRIELVTRAWCSARSPRGGRVAGGWVDKWLHDARVDVPAGTEDVRLRARLPASGTGS
jgi:hypothetical protein